MFSSKYRYLYVALLGVYSYLNIKFTEGDQLFTFYLPEVFLFLLILLLVFLIWEGNRFITWFAGRRFKNLNIYKSLILGFLASIILVGTLSLLTTWVISFYYSGIVSISFRLALGFTFRVNLFLHCIHAIASYHSRLRSIEVEAEKMKKENAFAQYHSLRRQINPHFLFNSLNVLDSLVRKDAKAASHFIEQLAKVYRYLVDEDDRELVPLSEELVFIEAYRQLLEIRHKDNLFFDIRIEEIHKGWLIVPSALQLLIENAVKHNEVSKTTPLTIEIYSAGNYLIVSNQIQKKENDQTGSGYGLKNIQKRYEFFNDVHVVVEMDKDKFTVRLPLLQSLN